MKIRLTIHITLLLFLIIRCSTKEKKNEVAPQNYIKEKPFVKTGPNFSVTDCIHNALYYLDDSEINTYDSIDVHYFHEVMGYTNTNALELEREIQILKQNILFDTLNNLSIIKKNEIQLRMIDLRHELHSFDKKVIGFIFVHTYSIKQDTLSAIIIMNKNCSNSEAIPVTAIKDIDPSDYAYRVKIIETRI